MGESVLPPAAGAAARPVFGAFDLAFVLLLLTALSTVSYLGVHGFFEGRRVLEVLANGGEVMAWMEKAHALREAGPEGLPAACARGGAAPGSVGVKALQWSDCLAALREPGQPLAHYINHLRPDGMVFSSKCDLVMGLANIL
ncbi:MAG: hypothetical protein ACR2I0_03800, partial [Rhodoferax sp.]